MATNGRGLAITGYRNMGGMLCVSARRRAERGMALSGPSQGQCRGHTQFYVRHVI